MFSLTCARTRLLPSLSRPLSTLPLTPTCPSPTCECAPAPAHLEIDRTTPLLNTMAAYAQQVVLCTGKENWESNIEAEEGETGEFVKGVKGEVGRGGKAFDPFNNILLTASSLPAKPSNETTPPSTTTTTTIKSTTALLFPSFLRLPSIPHTPTAFSHFASAYLKASTLHPMHSALPPAQKALLLRNPSLAAHLPAAEPITTPTVLICGHGARDQRCGILGPILQSAFRADLHRRGIKADVAQISHIGGHKYAGNVIIYIPPNAGTELAGMGIWYGRVGPEQVEGVVGETIVKGRIISELLRGGVIRGGGDVGRVVEGMLRRERGEEGGLKLKPRRRRG